MCTVDLDLDLDLGNSERKKVVDFRYIMAPGTALASSYPNDLNLTCRVKSDKSENG